MSPPPVRVGIILYVNRSGSTLLSRLLSGSLVDTFVFPELRFTLDLLVAGRTLEPAALLRLMHADPRLASLGLTDSQVAAAAAHGADDLHGILVALATAALGRRPAAMILKLEPYVGLIPQLDAAFDTPVLIHIVRDPRAVAHSMRTTPVPEKPGFDMARGSYLYAARHWRDYMARVAALRPVITVRYETLGDPAVITGIAAALGVPIAPGGAPYAIAPIDAALHPHARRPFDPARAGSWRAALAPADIAMIEATCGAQMHRLGYTRTAPPPRPLARLTAYARHLHAMATHTARTALTYARRRDAIAALAARLRLAHRIGRL